MVRSLPLFHILVFYFIFLNVVLDRGEALDASTADALRKVVQEFDDFKKQLAGIDARLKTIQTIVERKTMSDDSTCLVRDITEAIRSHKFELAEEKLNTLDDKTKISNMVHDVFAGSPLNVDVILEFARSLSNANAQFLVFSALCDEMGSSKHSDPYKWIIFVETFERELNTRGNAELSAKAKLVIDNAIKKLKDTSAGIFKTAMINNKYNDNVEIDNLAKAVFEFRTDVSNEVMDRLVDSVFGVVAAKKILEHISSHKAIPQAIAGLTALFNRFNYAGNLNNDVTLSLASHLRKLQLRDKYPNLSPDLKDDVDKVIQQLPSCAKNLFFHTNICFWNKARKQYMYAASSSISYDAERRSIFTWYQGDTKQGAFWEMEMIGEDYYFINRDYAHEYLYAAVFDFNKDMRYIFTWVPGHNNDTQSAFAIELDGDYCYIRSTFFNEYLVAPTDRHDKQNSYVFTWKPGTSVRSAEFQWQIRNCGQAYGNGMKGA